MKALGKITCMILLTIFESAGTAEAQHNDKLIVYQLLPRLFGNQHQANVPFGTIEQNGCGKFADITNKALDGIKELGVTHIWYTGIIAHASLTDYSKYGIKPDDADVVKGRAGSPYAIRDYYDVDPDLAVDVSSRMAEFESLVHRTHKKGIKVIIDFVPNHVARNYHSIAKPSGVEDFGANDDVSKTFSPANDYYYVPGKAFIVPTSITQTPLADLQDKQFAENPAKATGNNVFSENPKNDDWYETVKLNYGIDYANGDQQYFQPVPPVWMKMRDILTYWTKKGVDGFRCDVAEMVPVAFWEWVIPEVKKANPNLVFIGEAYNPKVYQEYLNKGNFSYLYDKVGLYDGLKKLIKNEPAADVSDISKVWQIESKEFGNRMLRFLENHDEERVASKGFAENPLYAVPAMVVSATLSGGPVMLYFGQEVGEPGKGIEGFGRDDNRTTIFDYWGVPEHQKWMNKGAFDGAGLNADQKQLREFYKQLLNLARKSEAIIKGSITEVPLADKHLYAYIRHTANQRLLIIVNFSRIEKWNKVVQIPEHLLGNRPVSKPTDLLSNALLTENTANKIHIRLMPFSAQIIAF